MKHKIICAECKTEFNSSWSHTKVCSNECRTERAKKVLGRNVSVNTGIAPGTVGVISEYYVITYLLEKGYAVFHAASPSCYCDLLAVKSGMIFSLEVRTCYEGEGGKLTYSKVLNKGQSVPEYFGLVERNTKRILFVNVLTNEKVEL